MKRISHKELLALVRYNPNTGKWTRISNRFGRGWKRERVGYIMPTGYRRVKIANKRYMSSVLAWFYMTGKWPKRIVDHKDNNKTNDRWKNLRLATRRQNRVNSKCRKDNKSGFKGVHRRKNGQFAAVISNRNVHTYLGNFVDPREANRAYLSEAKLRYGEFARAQ